MAQTLQQILAAELAAHGRDVITVDEIKAHREGKKNKKPALYTPKEYSPMAELPEDIHIIRINGLPKWSTNNSYAGSAYYSRKKVKDTYKKKITEQVNKIITFRCICVYEFFFNTHGLDATNCSIMAKMIEDCLIPNDNYRNVGGAFLRSAKTNESDYVVLSIYPATPKGVSALAIKVKSMGDEFVEMKIDKQNRIIL
jgi:hypothetical protein